MAANKDLFCRLQLVHSIVHLGKSFLMRLGNNSTKHVLLYL